MAAPHVPWSIGAMAASPTWFMIGHTGKPLGSTPTVAGWRASLEFGQFLLEFRPAACQSLALAVDPVRSSSNSRRRAAQRRLELLGVSIRSSSASSVADLLRGNVDSWTSVR
jgi:hypothetical protein